MADQIDQIHFEHLGIARVLDTKQLHVPLNQREYSWEADHVSALYADLWNACAGGKSYFLGTIVLTHGAEIADGQQRLATTMIMFAAVRDWLLKHDTVTRAKHIEDHYLFGTVLRTEDKVPKVTLNVDDREFFTKRILHRPGEPGKNQAPTRQSHRLLVSAYEQAHAKIGDMLAGFSEDHRANRLFDWVEYLEGRALVIVLGVPSHLNAFEMFETLNDRGLKASQADLIKNHLLSVAGDRIEEAQHKWARMLGALESIGADDLTVTYLHHYLITTDGPTKEREVFEKIRKRSTSQASALDLLTKLCTDATDYAALFNSDHEKWNEYDSSIRKSIGTFQRDLRVEQIRPLMFAVARTFSPKEAARAFRMFVCWSVRFLIVGGRGGFLDRNYAVLASQVGNRTIKNATSLAEAAAKDIVPKDAEFEAAFSSAQVSQSRLARYYLRAIENSRKQQPDPEWVASDDTKGVNLEHVLPEVPGSAWPNVTDDDAVAYWRRIGNLAIMQANKNSKLGNQGFSEKRPVLGQSTYCWTAEIAKETTWGPKQIGERQRRLAAAAVLTWPLKIT